MLGRNCRRLSKNLGMTRDDEFFWHTCRVSRPSGRPLVFPTFGQWSPALSIEPRLSARNVLDGVETGSGGPFWLALAAVSGVSVEGVMTTAAYRTDAMPRERPNTCWSYQRSGTGLRSRASSLGVPRATCPTVTGRRAADAPVGVGNGVWRCGWGRHS